jgi:hypothetical protein
MWWGEKKRKRCCSWVLDGECDVRKEREEGGMRTCEMRKVYRAPPSPLNEANAFSQADIPVPWYESLKVHKLAGFRGLMSDFIRRLAGLMCTSVRLLSTFEKHCESQGSNLFDTN